MPKDFLSPDDQAKVADAAGKDLEEVSGSPSTPAEDSSLVSTPADQPKEGEVDTEPEETPAAEPKVDGDVKVGQPVPYEQYESALARQRELEERMAREVELAGRARAQAHLEDIARRRPDLAAEIYGPDSPQAKAQEKLPEDPVQRKLVELERETKATKDWREKQEHMEMVRDVESRAEVEMDKYPVLTKNPKVQSMAEREIVQRILTDPRIPVENIVKAVAADFREFEESIKAEYKQAKVQTAKKIPAGVGPGGAAPPGAARKKFSLDRPGELSKALAGAMKEGE